MRTYVSIYFEWILYYFETVLFSLSSSSVIRDIFQSKDVNNDGFINTSELDECLRVVGFVPTDDDLVLLKKTFDENGYWHYISLLVISADDDDDDNNNIFFFLKRERNFSMLSAFCFV